MRQRRVAPAPGARGAWRRRRTAAAALRAGHSGGQSALPPCRVGRDGEREGGKEKRLSRLTSEGNGAGRRPPMRTHRRGERRGRGGGCAALGGVVASGD